MAYRAPLLPQSLAVDTVPTNRVGFCMQNEIAPETIDEASEAAQAAVFRLFGYLGAGERLISSLQALSGVQTFVASPFKGRMDIFRVSVHGADVTSPLRLRVEHAPDVGNIHNLDATPASTNGYWVAVLQAAVTSGPFQLKSLSYEGIDCELRSPCRPVTEPG